LQLPRFAGAQCMSSEDSALPTHHLMVFEDRNSSAGFAGDEDAGPGTTIILLDDGRLVTQPNGRTREQIAAGDSGTTVRRLSPRGIELLLAQIDGTGLAVPGCHYDLLSHGQLRLLDVRMPGRPVASTHWGTYSGIDDPLREEDRAALATLQARIQRPEEWLSAEAWLDAENRNLSPERWRIVVRLVPAAAAFTLEAPLGFDLPAVEALDLPGAPDLRVYGTRVGEELKGIVVRCAVVDAAIANALVQHFNRNGAPIANFSFWVADGDDRVMVSVQPLVDAASGCRPVDLGLAPPGRSPAGP
jgi:hypothetical protein